MAKAKTIRTPKKGRQTVIRRPIWMPKFLRALSESGNVTASCKEAAVGRMTVYELREADPEFASDWDNAIDMSIDELEGEARRRAMAGSDTMLIFTLKGLRPEKYRDLNVNALADLIIRKQGAQTSSPVDPSSTPKPQAGS
ncbi:MAG: hypothetical protein KGL39_24885 [Patescibacteria group bacterium]|nr:hypothetical protein [Patescibacteria group bacterium]